MVAEPIVTAVEHSAKGVRVDLRIPPNLSCFAGHFPGCPLLPGVVQVGWAISHGRQHFALGPEVRGLTALKFMRVIEPGAAITLHLRNPEGSARLQFEYREDGQACSSGNIVFAA